MSVPICSNIWVDCYVLRQEEDTGTFFHAFVFSAWNCASIFGVAVATLHLDSFNLLIIFRNTEALSSIFSIVWLSIGVVSRPVPEISQHSNRLRVV